MLLHHYKLDINDVFQHNKWSGKDCPIYLRSGKYGYNWTWFKERVKAHLGSSNVSTSSGDSFKRVVGQIQVLSDTLNVREKADFDSKKVDTLKKGDKLEVMASKNGLYMIKEGQ